MGELIFGFLCLSALILFVVWVINRKPKYDPKGLKDNSTTKSDKLDANGD